MVSIPLLVGTMSSTLLVGGAFGARHAFEADHVAAVSTLVVDEERPVATGAAWGIGHSIPILLLGVFFLAVGIRVSGGIAMAFDLLVAVVLVGLGIRVLAGREAFGLTVLRHIHGNRNEHASGGHRHLSIGDREIGLTHTHAHEESMAVGIIHGFAGSGGIVVALAAAAPTVTGGLAFLVGFAIASVGAMSVAAVAWGRIVGHEATLRIVAGGASIVVGLLLVAEISGVMTPL